MGKVVSRKGPPFAAAVPLLSAVLRASAKAQQSDIRDWRAAIDRLCVLGDDVGLTPAGLTPAETVARLITKAFSDPQALLRAIQGETSLDDALSHYKQYMTEKGGTWP
jgi:hypothetical protein